MADSALLPLAAALLAQVAPEMVRGGMWLLRCEWWWGRLCPVHQLLWVEAAAGVLTVVVVGLAWHLLAVQAQPVPAAGVWGWAAVVLLAPAPAAAAAAGRAAGDLRPPADL